MGKTIALVPHSDCTGCGACLNICSFSAINMRQDEEGFLYPVINKDICVDCGKCHAVCPAVTPEYHNRSTPKCYAVLAADEIRKKSSSGGVFSVLADYVLSQGGLVCGAVYTEDFHNVQHIIINDKSGLGKLRGSKYVQSDTGFCFTRIKTGLEGGKAVLFTGTPCQVAGLYKYLGKDYDKLFTADLVCHGVPSVRLLDQFLTEHEEKYNSKVTYLSFRDKEVYGWTHSTTIRFASGDCIEAGRNKSPYLNAFLNLLDLRQCCGNCQFAKLPRQGDVTIADFWDVHRYDPKLDDRLGTSAVLVNNRKGGILLDELKKAAKVVSEVPLEHAVKYNPQIKYSSIHHKERKRFFELLNNYQRPFEESVSSALHRHFDVGYVGWWYGLNYGSVLTSYALNRVLESLGKTVLMLDFPYLEGQYSGKNDSASRRFASHFYETSMRRRVDQHTDLNYYCDTFLVGSDQLWNWWSNRDIGTYYYFLDFANKDHRKIAYATSFGHEKGYYPEDMRIRVSYLLHRFDAVSVREKTGVEICRDTFNVHAVQKIDPVFLCPMDDYEKAVSLSKVSINSPFVLAYILNPSEDKIKAVRYAANTKGLPYYIIIDGQGDQEELKASFGSEDQVLSSIEIADWLYYFKNADFIVTDSYHGFCFSIIFHKQFAVFPNKLRGTTRFEALGNITGLNRRFVSSFDEMIRKGLTEEIIDYGTVDLSLKVEVDEGMQWLKQALDCRHHYESAETLALWKILEYDALLDKQKNNEEFGKTYKSGQKNILVKVSGSAGKGVRMVKKHGVGECVRYLKEKGVRKTLQELWRGDDR